MKFNKLVAVAMLAGSLAPTVSFAQSTGDWTYQATLYGYFPTISGSTVFPGSAGGGSASVDIDTILDALKFAFMGSFEASNGQWGVLADVIYLDVGGSKGQTREFSLGSAGLPAGVSANVGLDLKGWVSTLAGTYRVAQGSPATVDLVAGVRALTLRSSVNWALTGNVGAIVVSERAGSRDSSGQNMDVVVGARGRVRPSDSAWFFPFHLDIGTGESKFTWQAIGGVGYAFGWGDVVAAWRHTDYRMEADQTVRDLTLSGPGIAAVFRW